MHMYVGRQFNFRVSSINYVIGASIFMIKVLQLLSWTSKLYVVNHFGHFNVFSFLVLSCQSRTMYICIYTYKHMYLQQHIKAMYIHVYIHTY